MKRLLAVLGILAILAVVALATNPLGAQSEKTLDVKEIMGKLNKGPNALHPTLGKELKDDEPAWDEIQKQAKEFATLATALGKNDPPRGAKESWAKQTKAYADNAKSLSDAALKKDKPAAQSAWGKMGQAACRACHTAHRPMGN